MQNDNQRAFLQCRLDCRAASEAMFDEEFDDPPEDFTHSRGDINEYSRGRIGKHCVVVVSLPDDEYGTTAATTVAQALRSSLPHIRVGVLVGVGAGIPGDTVNSDGTITLRRPEIQLGDVVVSERTGTGGGVVQLDMVKMSETDS